MRVVIPAQAGIQFVGVALPVPLVCHHPLRLILRRSSGQGPPAAGRSLVPACACGSCSLREAAPGFRPGSRPPFLYRQERRQRSDPCRLGPCCARAALRCSVCAAAPNSLRSLRSLRSDKRREVSSGCALARAPQSPALLSSSEGGDEHQTRLASHRRDGASLARARCEARWDKESLRSKRPYCSWGPSEPSRSAGLCRGAQRLRPLTSGGCLNAAAAGRVVSSARPAKTEHRRAVGPRPTGEGGRLSFGSFSLAKQRKGTALSGAHPDAASRSEQDPQRDSGTTEELIPSAPPSPPTTPAA